LGPLFVETFSSPCVRDCDLVFLDPVVERSRVRFARSCISVLDLSSVEQWPYQPFAFIKNKTGQGWHAQIDQVVGAKNVEPRCATTLTIPVLLPFILLSHVV